MGARIFVLFTNVSMSGTSRHSVNMFEWWDVCAQLLGWVWLFCDPMDCSSPASSVHGISQARILEWVAISFSRGSSQPKGQTQASFESCIGSQILLPLSYLRSPNDGGQAWTEMISYRQLSSRLSLGHCDNPEHFAVYVLFGKWVA